MHSRMHDEMCHRNECVVESILATLQNVKVNMSLYMVTILAGMPVHTLLLPYMLTHAHFHFTTIVVFCHVYQNVHLIDRGIPMYVWCAHFCTATSYVIICMPGHCTCSIHTPSSVLFIPPPLPDLTTLFLSLSFSKGYIQSQPRSQGDQLSSTNLYIRGLSQRCTDEDLVKMCHQ